LRFASTAVVKDLPSPRVILFDWHGTLVDTSVAMYRAMDDMLRELDRLGLGDRLIAREKSKTKDDRKLVAYVRAHRRLHPKVVADRKASRTDLLEVLFGEDQEAKDIANTAYNECYRNHYGDVRPLQPGVRVLLSELQDLGIRLGILTNRSREFLEKELEAIEGGSWRPYFECTVSGTDTRHLKPSPAPVLKALQDLGEAPGAHVWYVGDSVSDTVSAKTAGIASIFFNGARGDSEWIATIFPGTALQPYRPDGIVETYQDLSRVVMLVIGQVE
jgi:phosphoglycolate phosphatase